MLREIDLSPQDLAAYLMADKFERASKVLHTRTASDTEDVLKVLLASPFAEQVPKLCLASMKFTSFPFRNGTALLAHVDQPSFERHFPATASKEVKAVFIKRALAAARPDLAAFLLERAAITRGADFPVRLLVGPEIMGARAAALCTLLRLGYSADQILPPLVAEYGDTSIAESWLKTATKICRKELDESIARMGQGPLRARIPSELLESCQQRVRVRSSAVSVPMMAPP